MMTMMMMTTMTSSATTAVAVDQIVLLVFFNFEYRYVHTKWNALLVVCTCQCGWWLVLHLSAEKCKHLFDYIVRFFNGSLQQPKTVWRWCGWHQVTMTAPKTEWDEISSSLNFPSWAKYTLTCTQNRNNIPQSNCLPSNPPANET